MGGGGSVRVVESSSLERELIIISKDMFTEDVRDRMKRTVKTSKRGMKSKVKKECGFSRIALYSWITGKYNPSGENLQKFCNYFGVPIRYILFGEIPEKEGDKK